MQGWNRFAGKLARLGRSATLAGLAGIFILLPCSATAQIHGIPPSVTSIPNHVPPFLPNAPASVTSLGPCGYCGSRPSNIPYRNPAFPNYGRHNRGYGRNGYGSVYGYGYAMPYYVYPAYDPGYDTSDQGGPYLYSGPPGPQAPPAEQTLHIIVDQAPSKHAVSNEELADEQPPPAPQQAIPDAKPGLATTLVYRDGHKQEVTNYAIMGQTLYVFDNRTKKISLADLDVPATIKANDDEGVEFQLPKSKQPAPPRKSSGVPLQSLPEEAPKAPSSFSSTP